MIYIFRILNFRWIMINNKYNENSERRNISVLYEVKNTFICLSSEWENTKLSVHSKHKFMFQSCYYWNWRLTSYVWWPISPIRNIHYESEYEFEIEAKIEFEVKLELKSVFKIEFLSLLKLFFNENSNLNSKLFLNN